MAAVKHLNGEQLLVQIGNGATPEVFVHDCLINTERGIVFSSNMSEVLIPDCDDSTLPGWIEREKDGLSAAVNGAGMLHTTSVETFWNWFKSKDTKNCRILVNTTGANGGGYWAGAFHLSEFSVTGNRKEKATSSVSLMSDGEVTWVDAA